jgi:DNA-binding transcriptional regulator YiaG
MPPNTKGHLPGYAQRGKPSIYKDDAEGFSRRKIVCSVCVMDDDILLGNTFASRTCGRCSKPIEAGCVIQQRAATKRSLLSIGAELRALRESVQLTQVQMAERIGRSPTIVTQAEIGQAVGRNTEARIRKVVAAELAKLQTQACSVA